MKSMLLSRLLIAISGLILAAGALMHAAAYKGTVAAVAGSNLPAFYAGSFKALWLIDSATLLILGIAFVVWAARPALAGTTFLVLVGLIPAATSVFLYRFIGTRFLPAHLLLSAAILVILGAIIRTD